MYSSCNADDAAAAVPWEQRRTSGTLEAGSELRYAGKKGGSVYTMGEILIRVPEKGRVMYAQVHSVNVRAEYLFFIGCAAYGVLGGPVERQ